MQETKTHRHRSFTALLAIMTFLVAFTAFADNTKVTQPQPDNNAITLTSSTNQQFQQAAGIEATLALQPDWATQVTQFRTLGQNRQQTVANNFVGTMTLNGVQFDVSLQTAQEQMSADAIKVTFSSSGQQAVAGVQAVLVLNDNWANEIAQIRTFQNQRQVTTTPAPVSFAKMTIGATSLGLVPRQVNSTIARISAPTDNVNRDSLAFKQKETRIEAPTATNTPMKK